ncbi:MAG: hypothetical protein WKH64_17650 [Chloroflexia bacterium]
MFATRSGSGCRNDEITGTPNTRFWIVVSGGKTNTAKWWDPQRYQAVVDHFRDRLLFAQCGDRGRATCIRRWMEWSTWSATDLRLVRRLPRRGRRVPGDPLSARGGPCPPKPGRPMAARVVVAGGREPAQWEAYPHHQYLHTNGCLPCRPAAGRAESSRWGPGTPTASVRRRVREGRSDDPVSGMITPAVIEAIERYLQFGDAKEA